MAVTPPIPSNAPTIGGTFYCETPGGWPNQYTATARWGGIAVVTDMRYISNTWQVIFRSIWNPTYIINGCHTPIADFYNNFGKQKLLVITLPIIGFGMCDIHTMQRHISGTGGGMVAGILGNNNRLLVEHVLTGTGGSMDNPININHVLQPIVRT